MCIMGSDSNSYLHLDEIVISKANPKLRVGFDVKTANGTRQTIRLIGEGFRSQRAKRWFAGVCQ